MRDPSNARIIQVSPIPEDIQDRRVEITGPVDRKMVINALNSGANVYMADFEDSNAPTWYALCFSSLLNAPHFGSLFAWSCTLRDHCHIVASVGQKAVASANLESVSLLFC